MPAPIPLEPPVTIATLPFNFDILFLLLRAWRLAASYCSSEG